MNDESTDYLEENKEASLLEAIKRSESERKELKVSVEPEDKELKLAVESEGKELKVSVDREPKVFQKYQHESIRYAPLPLLRKKMERVSRYAITITFGMLLLLCVGWIFSPDVFIICFLAFLSISILAFLIALGVGSNMSASAADKTGYISANEDVLKLPFYGGSIVLSWSDLLSTELRGANSDQIVLVFDCSDWPDRTRHLADLFGKMRNEKQEVILELSAVPQRSRQSFLLLLRKSIPANRLSNKLRAFLFEKKETCSFTEIWMSSIKRGGERLNEQQLPEGTFLNDMRYEIVRIAGAGGQGVAYEAIDHLADASTGVPTRVILKEFILPVHADEEISRKALMAVEHEEAILKQLAAEHIVELYDSFVEDFRAYLVLELIEGQSLRQIVEANGAMEQTKVIKLAIQMCDILAHLHSFKPPIVHRDFTPENLILSHNEMLKLIDFDVARQEDNSHLNQVVGKPSYIAPEQFRGQSIPASDIYSLGASMFFLLTGKEPTPIQASHPRRVVESISEPLDALVAKATASNLQERFTTAEELKRAIEELQS